MPLTPEATAALASLNLDPNTLSDMTAVINASPQLTQQLNTFVGSSRNGSLSGSAALSDDRGTYTPSGQSANNSTGGSILIYKNQIPSDSGFSQGYALAETLAHELGHAYDPQQGTTAIANAGGDPARLAELYVKSEGAAEINAYNVMSQARSSLVGAGANTSASGGTLIDPSDIHFTQFARAETAYVACQRNATSSNGSAASALSNNDQCLADVTAVMSSRYYDSYYNYFSNSTGPAPAHQFILNQTASTTVSFDTTNPDEITYTNSQTGAVTTLSMAFNPDGSLTQTVDSLISGQESARSVVTDSPTGAFSIDISGSGYALDAENATITTAASSFASDSIYGNGNTVTEGAGTYLSIYYGTNNNFTLNAGASINVDTGIPGATETVNSNNGAIYISGYNGQINVNGSGNTISSIGSGERIVSTGNTVNDSNSNGSSVNEVIGDSNTISTSISGAALALGDGSENDTIETSSGYTSSIIASYGDVNFAGSGSYDNIKGYNEVINAGANETVRVGGKNEVVNADGATIAASANTTLDVNGADTIQIGYSGDGITSDGSTMNVVGYHIGDILYSNNDTFNQAGTSNGDSFVIAGSNNSGALASDNLNFLGDVSSDTVSSDGGSWNQVTDTSTYGTFEAPIAPIYSPGGVTPSYNDNFINDNSGFPVGDSSGGFDDELSPDGDPIIFNLSGAAVTTQSLATSSVYFDEQNNGNLVHTGWGVAGEGYLVYDPRGTTTTANSELSLVSGFPALSALDTNHDGVLNVLDSTWAHLKIWVDNSASGAVSGSSLSTIDSLGISSISLASSHVNSVDNGNKILDESTFTWAAGGTGDIAGVGFAFDSTDVLSRGNPLSHNVMDGAVHSKMT